MAADPRAADLTRDDVMLGDLEREPYAVLAELRERTPVAWIPALDGWIVTRRDLCIAVMRDAERFTVDDPRFSTAQVVGPSMLSLDGAEHRRHRDPFATALRGPEVRTDYAAWIADEARRLVAAVASRGEADVRRDLAGPLAIGVVARTLGMAGADIDLLRRWYDDIVAAVDAVSTGGEVSPAAVRAMRDLGDQVTTTAARGDGVLVLAAAALPAPAVVSNAAVMLFGGIETSEGQTTSLFWHLLAEPEQLAAVRADRSLVAGAVEESMRLEPAASRVDRYATVDVELGGATIRRGDLVIVSLTAANRDPATHPDPDRFDARRANARSHLTFAQGPHACVGMTLARLEAQAALEAALDGWPGFELGPGSRPPAGLIFRKPPVLRVRWDRGGGQDT